MNRTEPSKERRRQGWLLAGLSLLACPCNLVIAISLLSGTAMGAFLSEQALAASGIMFLVFMLAGAGALRLLDHIPTSEGCGCDSRNHASRNRAGQSAPNNPARAGREPGVRTNHR